MTLNDLLIDKRIVRRNIEKGRLDSAEYQRLLSALPDCAGKLWRPGEGGDAPRAAAPAAPPHAPVTAAPSTPPAALSAAAPSDSSESEPEEDDEDDDIEQPVPMAPV